MAMLVRPVYNAKYVCQFPIRAFTLVPIEVRKSCCFIGVEHSEHQKIGCGSGFLTHLGIITAYHVVNVEKPDLVYASFIHSDHDYFSFELGEALVFPELDLAIFEAPTILSDFYEPASVIVDQPNLVKEILKKEKIYGFGCPQGILGIVWEAKPLAFHEGKIYSKGLAFFGISGGPMFYLKDGKLVVLAINFAIYAGSGTIISRTLELNLREGGDKRDCSL